MGDLVEITTFPRQQCVSYKINTGAMRFQVKTMSSAGIGLSNRENKCHLWIVLGQGRSIIKVKKNNQTKLSVETPNILSQNEFRDFYMTWFSDLICVGRDEENPFIVYPKKNIHYKYVTFTAIGNTSFPCQWRFEMPPLREKMEMKTFSSGIPRWVVPGDTQQLPDGAIIGGNEKEMLYIIRAEHQGSLTPGKYVPSHGRGYISWGGLSNEKSDFEVLCGYNCTWVRCCKGRVPVGAVAAGYTEGLEQELLYVGRAMYKGYIIPGKVQPSHRVCYIPYHNIEIGIKHYEILVVPQKNVENSYPHYMCRHVTDRLYQSLHPICSTRMSLKLPPLYLEADALQQNMEDILNNK